MIPIRNGRVPVNNRILQHKIIDDFNVDATRVVASEPSVAIWALSAPAGAEDTAPRVAITDQPFSIGRNPSCSLPISNSTVSGLHAEFILAGERLLIRDCNSTNGTLLNGNPIHTVENLTDGDILHFGNAMYVVHRGVMPIGMPTVCADTADEALA